ncbi:MAG TPA: phage tail family protein [Desulfitobacterium dehalogenans]|uniref:Phage tail family protein n=1 Tax=Desulfitobacterium dehalogenans TaxID=36854 RepID=A0A7C7D9C2_9FIRM|nr:phage tail family protein [Desulfitobacterium dehalogenans]
MKITCENERGEQLTLGWFAPLWIRSITGLGASYAISTSKNNGQDGEHYTGAVAEKRNIVIVLDVRKSDYVTQRNLLYNFFQPRSQGTLFYEENSIARKIKYYVESIEPSGDGILKNITLSLICPDPKWYDIHDNLVQLAIWQGNIRFPLRLRDPFAVTKKVNTLIGNVRNDSAVTMGLAVRFTATGTVVNPSLYDVNRHELMKINTTMHAGDKITITTGTGNKRVILISGGITTNINNLMAYPPKWLQAYHGDNLFRYDADSGIDSLSVSILTTQAYWGT